MKLKELFEAQYQLNEMPMIKHGAYGQFDSDVDFNFYGKPSDMRDDNTSWHKRADRLLVTNPTHIKKLEHMFARTKHKFAIFAIDNHIAKTNLKGQVLNNKRDLVEEFLGHYAAEQIYDNYKDCITLLVAENSGDKDDVPMLPWMYAHKLWHFIDERDTIPPSVTNLKHQTKQLISDYAYSQFGAYDSGVHQMIGTSKAFRKKQITASFEVANELFCQFINTGGKIHLNQAASILSPEQSEELISVTTTKLEELYEEILTQLKGQILFLTA